MRLVADSGLWGTGPGHEPIAATPLVAVLEVSGAVLSWTVDDPPGDAATRDHLHRFVTRRLALARSR